MKNLKIGYEFKNPELLQTAFIHPSYRNEKGGGVDNQRLEFLGDSVVGCVASEILWNIFPDSDEGELSVKKSAIVRGENLAGYAEKLGFAGCLLFGKGESRAGGRKTSNLADVFEAFVGAVFLDGGYAAAREIVSVLIMGNREEWNAATDCKSELQRVFHKKFGTLPVYETHETGPEHNKYFFSEVGDGSGIFGRGQGKNKKQAEQRAAEEALDFL